jgi:hypothetical protein
MVFIRLAGAGAKSLRAGTQKRKVSREAEESQKQHTAFSARLIEEIRKETFKEKH